MVPIATYQHIALIYNPVAGRIQRQGNTYIAAALHTLREAGHSVEPMPTTGPRTAAALARQAIQDGADLVMAAGGDGTINEVVNGMAGSRVPLGILPAGTANVLASETGIARDAAAAAQGIAQAVPCRVALGSLHTAAEAPDRYFLLMAGIGMDAHIVYHLDLSFKAWAGKLSYWLGGFSLVGRPLEEFDVQVDGDTYRVSFALVSRVRNYGGDLAIARNAHLLDDDFEVVLFTGRNASIYLKYFTGVLLGGLDRMGGVIVRRAHRLNLMGTPQSQVYIQVDGEYAGRLPAQVEVVPNGLTLLLPERYVRRRVEAAAQAQG